ncbi:MAG: hypothetical protein VYD78_02305 [Gemmatimonadota bacterium]|nr:hypothetical protein [Gemmatimonadota bacterium]
MSDDDQVRGILLSHGKLAEGMVDAVQRIVGVDDDVLVALSNEGHNSQGLADSIDAVLGDSPAVIFTDLCTGSCAVTAQITCRGGGRRVVVFGMNLPMLLEFVFHRRLALEDLVPRLLEKGKQSMKSSPIAE